MQSTNNAKGEATENWPRDFDIRAQYAEQQELQIDDVSPTVAVTVQQDTPLQGNHKND
ncbi:hypothetical protein NRB16_25150 [Pseudomonas sp. LJDD11]|uniref:hypothetical protein n=1 Tax=Pseudomonas sp. LJDD11 TaxID=2931984 RepID=UPI00211C85FD|nr:hypothetical protein [Pseudomonas sp. LJDD11]MCQ9426810.1 hypothetical protein [Pseudomonas sp. LJDD11]